VGSAFYVMQKFFACTINLTKLHCFFTHTHTRAHAINSLHSQCQDSSLLYTSTRDEKSRERRPYSP